MITESLVRITGEAGLRNWPMVKEASVSPSGVMTSRELALLFPENSFNGNKKNHVPNRSGSAPPSIEESCAMWNNDAGQRHPSPFGNIVRTSMDKGYDSEEQIRSQPSYAAFYSSNVNLNPRLPPPITSRETRHLAHHTNNSVEIRKSSTYTDESAGSRFSHLTSLPTHTEDSDNVQALDHDSSGNAERLLSGQFVSSLEGRHTSVVDLIQEDFPRTPSPLYSNPVSSHRASEDRANDACASTSQQKDSDAKRKLLKLGSRTCVASPAGHSGKSIRSNGSTERQLFTRSHSQSASQKEVPGMNGNSVPTSLTDANRDTLSTALQGLHISSKNEVEYSRQNPQPSNLFPQDLTSQVPVLQYHGVGSTFNIGNQFIQGQTKLPVDAQKSVLQNTVTATPFVSAAGFLPSGSPIYSNMPSMLSPHYNIGGYTANISPFLPSFAGYPPSGAHPMTFESYPAVGINAANGNTASGLDLQYPYKYYGQMGVVLQPSLSDPLYVPYFQHPAVGAYGAPVQYELTNRVHDIQKGPPAYLHDQRQMHVSGGSLSPIKIGIPSTTQYTNLPNVGVIVQYPASPLASPKPLVQPALPVRRFENSKLHACPIKNAGTYSGWQVPKDIDVNGENKSYLILEELKSNKCHRFELSDVVGHVVELSTDQHGSRFIQQKLEFCCDAEKASVFSEVLPRSAMLMTDVFGNYVIQKFFEYGSTEQRKELANQLVGRVLPLSLQMYGCRVIQKALEVVEVDQKTELVVELNGHVMRCVRDQNGNHVIQKCIECVPTDRILFIISSFHGQIASLSMHPYGCRVIQRVLEHCTDEAQIQCIVNEILQSAGLLAQDQYGNYVIQHVLERGKPHERNQIISKLSGQVVQMSQHKFASNVIEKCLQYGDAAEREDIIEEIVGETEGNDVLLMMMKDQFANYVVQKILDTCNDKQQEILLSRIRANLQVLKRYTYGKHIVARVEQLSGESHVASE